MSNLSQIKSMSQMQSTLDSIQQSQISNMNIPSLSAEVQQELLHSLVTAGRSLRITSLADLKNAYVVRVMLISEDQWAQANREYNAVENQMLAAEIALRQNPNLDQILDMIISRQINKEVAKATIQDWMKRETEQPLRQMQKQLDLDKQNSKFIIEQAESQKEKILERANQEATSIIEDAVAEVSRIKEEAEAAYRDEIDSRNEAHAIYLQELSQLKKQEQFMVQSIKNAQKLQKNLANIGKKR